MTGLSFHTLIILPAGLGLIGFVEPCTIGGHLIFLGTQQGQNRVQQTKAFITFVVARTTVAGGCGALIALLGRYIIDVQTTFWIVFGILYVCLGAAAVFGTTRYLKASIDIAPRSWRNATSPLTLGLAFGLNIPACAAPILFGLLTMAATGGTAAFGFVMMAVFGLAMSLPLALFIYVPRVTCWLTLAGGYMRRRRSVLAATFFVLGAWSIWFGLYVDPENWSGK